MTTRMRCGSGTGSSHTGCQIPLVRVYQIPRDFSSQNCFPRGMLVSVDGSSARTTIVRLRAGPASRVTSNENGVCPPSCSPAN